MQLTFNEALLSTQTDALIVAVRSHPSHSDSTLNRYLQTLLQDGTFSGAVDEVEVVYPVQGLGCKRVIFVGLGEENVTPASWRKAITAGYQHVKDKVSVLGVLMPSDADPSMLAESTVETVVSLSYRFHPYRTHPPEPSEKTLTELVLPCADKSNPANAARDALVLANVVNQARDWSNRPGNQLTVPELLKAIESVSSEHGLSCQVLDAAALKTEGLHLLLGVGRASIHQPALAVVTYQGAPNNDATIALVGKGLTFDTGGICIKPRAGMEEMKSDMHGVATVLGTLAVAASRRLPVNLVVAMPLAENMPGGNALKPGDILKAYDGQSVEVIDTDAEGRLVLADAIAWIIQHHQPGILIDVATLTGSIITTLGYEATGLFSPDDALAESLTQAGERTGERLWRMPIWPAYEKHIKSDIADWRNATPMKGDAIAAAAFLKQFVGQTRWAHLDIAGPSYLPESKQHLPKGSTGVGIRLLIDWLTHHHA